MTLSIGNSVSQSSPYAAAAVSGEKMPGLPTRDERRPEGDQRNAQQIQYDNPILNRTILSGSDDATPNGRESRDRLTNNLKQQVGDFTSDNQDPESRADANYRLAHAVNYIDSDPSLSRHQSRSPGDGTLDQKSEVDRLVTFSKEGYSALNQK
ncbi:hypothetical protein [Pseudomonas fluorescens]|nr:hypothetical protein [Pseudomonas fluorescens]